MVNLPWLDDKVATMTSTKSKAPPGRKVEGPHNIYQGFVDKPKVQSTQSAYPTNAPPRIMNPPKDNTQNNESQSFSTLTHTTPLVSKDKYPNTASPFIMNPPTITIHNDDKGNQATGNSVHPAKYDYKFESIITKNNTFLNTEDDAVMSTWEAVEKLKRQNPGWTELEAANYLNYGTTNRKGGKSKTANSASEKLLQETGLMNTWGMGIRGDYNFGKSMNVEEYSNGLDWVSAPSGQLSAEDYKVQRAILDQTKQFKKPSKFADFFNDMPSITGVLRKLQNIQPTRESFDTSVGSVGWDNLAIRQIQRGELMPDGSNPYDYLNKHENEEFKNLAGKYSMVKPDDYKPMKWFKESDLPQDEVDRRNAQLFEEDLVGIETGYSSQGEELFRTIKTEMENSNLDAINNIRIDGDIVSLNEAFQEGPDLMSNENEIANSSISSSVYQPSEEDKDTEDAKEKAIAEKYIHPGDRAGGFEALFGIPYSPHIENPEPQDTKDYVSGHTFAGSAPIWNESTGKYVYYDESLGQTVNFTPEEFRLEYNL